MTIDDENLFKFAKVENLDFHKALDTIADNIVNPKPKTESTAVEE